MTKISKAIWIKLVMMVMITYLELEFVKDGKLAALVAQLGEVLQLYRPVGDRLRDGAVLVSCVRKYS